MNVTSTGLERGYFFDRFGKRGNQKNSFGKVDYSIPFSIAEAPKDTGSFAFWLEDKDAIPVCGFSWIHWVGANLNRSTVAENESISNSHFIQGANSNVSPLAGAHSIEESSYYTSMSPPDTDHLYELHVFALDTMLDLGSGFFLNELYRKMQGHVLGTATLSGYYRA